MPTGAPRAAPGDPRAVLPIVWGAFLGSLCFYAVVLHFLLGTMPAPADGAGATSVLTSAGLALAVVATLAIWVLRRRVLDVPDPTRAAIPPEREFVVHLMSWALAEGVGLYGVVLGFVVRDVGSAVPFLVWAAVLLVALRPRAAGR